MTRTPFLAGNWKMFKTGAEAVAFIGELKPHLTKLGGRDIALAVPATALAAAAKAAEGAPLIIGAQNLHWEKEGAFTGEISGPMIKAAGASMVVIGHSERRTYFGDDDEKVSKKLEAALSCDLTPVVCVGENLEDRDTGRTLEVLSTQLSGSLSRLKAADAPKMVLAYEPVWAIGTGKSATEGEAQEVHVFLRRKLKEQFGEEAGKAVRIIYGGSVKPDNAAAILVQSEIDGLLIGGASLKVDSFVKIVSAPSDVQFV
ncbi:MAG: triose-phosphate isomerase [Deltaproteobacteria bacterium]|jgi:triosephosphate isomerase|nr:triose-phosphate isomerase [Deltaproteobacteria bacterium]